MRMRLWIYVCVVLVSVVLMCTVVPRPREAVSESPLPFPYTLSDERFKEEVRNVTQDEIEKLLEIRVKSFKVVDDKPKVTKYGFIAQEAEKIFPNSVIQFNGRKYMDYSQYIPLLLQAYQVMQADMKQVKADVEEVKKMAVAAAAKGAGAGVAKG